MTMTIDELERRLRLPAPDEPAVLPALLLPIQVGTSRPTERRLDLQAGRRRTSVPFVLVSAVLLLVAALAGALLTGALRIEYLRDALPIPGMYSGNGITIDYPDDWVRLTPHAPFGSSGANVVFIVGNRDVDGCEPDSEGVAQHTTPPESILPDGTVDVGNQQGVIYFPEDRIYACLTKQPLEPGEVRVVVSSDRPQAIGVGPVGDFAGSFLAPNPEVGGPVLVNEASGFTETVGGMPAQLIVRRFSVVREAEQLRTWIVAKPRSADILWWIQAVMRGPDLPALEAQVDDLARSLTFDSLPPPLDDSARDEALGTAIDEVDRQMRQYPGRRFVGCVPRTPGSVMATIVDAPLGRLANPLEVTCTTTVEANDLRVWQADIEVAWAATDEHAAGRWARRLQFDAEGTVHMEMDLAPGTGDPLAFPGDPSTLPLPTEVATFEPGDLARSVGAGAVTAFYDVDSSLLPPEPHLYPEPGAVVVIRSGPETYDERPFYLADDGHEVGWVGAVSPRGEPVLAPAEPVCPPEITITELIYTPTAERWRCVQGDVTFDRVQAGRPERDPTWGELDVDPPWLAGEPTWQLFGEGGRDGVDPGLPVALHPSVETLPTSGWLRVTGHFDDPASATCRIAYPESWDRVALPPDVQVRRCQERFVVTSVEPVEGS